MRAPLYLACWAMMATVWGAVADDGAGRFGASPVVGGSPNAAAAAAPRRLLEPLDVAADRETVAYLLPRLAAKYRPSGEWADVADPRFYVLTEMAEAAAQAQADADDAGYDEQGGFSDSRTKRGGRFRDPVTGGPGGSLSIVNSLDVLRNRLLLEIARKKAKEGANRNRQMLMNLGKRAPFYYDKF